MKKNKFIPNKEQKACIESTDRSVAILAGAGSGKTAVLVERIRRIVEGGFSNLSEIAAITFTEKAAGELLYRLTDELDPAFKTQIDLATITTIDGLCNKILREESAQIGLITDFQVMEEHSSRILNHRVVSGTLKQLLRTGFAGATTLIDELDFRYAICCLEEMVENRWKFLRCHPEQSEGPHGGSFSRTDLRMTAPTDRRESTLSTALHECFLKVLERLEYEKTQLGAIDFADLEIKTLELLEEREDIRQKYQSKFKHLLVDEYQDTSDLQGEIISHLYNPKKNTLCIVGDPGQSIYRFRGANPTGILKMRDLIQKNGGLEVRMTENFRSTENVLSFVNGLFEGSKNCFLPLTSHKGPSTLSHAAILDLSGEPLASDELREKEAGLIAEYIADINATDGINYGDVALLFRSFSSIQTYEAHLKGLDIPYYRNGGRTFLNQPEVADIILCLRVLASPENDTLAYGLARSSLSGLDDQQCFEMLGNKSGTAFEALSSLPHFSFLKELLQMKKFLSIPCLIERIIDLSHIDIALDHAAGSQQPSANIEKMMFFAESVCGQHGYTLEEFLEYIDDLELREIGIGEPPIFSQHDNAVKLLTVHAAKGLEFKVVILADINRGVVNYSRPYIADGLSREFGFKLTKGGNPIAARESTPAFETALLSEKEASVLEMERLLYVAATRAKERLIIPLATDANRPSPWTKIVTAVACGMQKVAVKNIERLASPSKQEIAIEAPMKSSVLHTRPLFTVSQLEAYHRCPQEYLLKYVMRLPASKIEPRKDEDMGAEMVGNVVHRMILLSTMKPCDEIAASVKEISASLCNFEIPPASEERIKDLFQKYRDSEFFTLNITDPVHEVPFVFDMKFAVVRGTIDCIYGSGPRRSIVDFKTDIIKKGTDIKAKSESYSLQTMIYAIAAEAALNVEVDKVALLFLDKGAAESTEITAANKKDMFTYINGIVDAIREEKFGDLNEKRPCESCPFHHNALCWRSRYNISLPL